MAKQKDHGELLEIFYEPERDSVKKFQKIARKVITTEQKDIVIDISAAPLLTSDYLAPLGLAAKALKAHGHTVTLILSSVNHDLLKKSEDASSFNFQVSDASNEQTGITLALEDEEEYQPISLGEIVENTIVLSEEESDSIPQKLPLTIQSLLNQGYPDVIVDLSNFFLITPAVIQTLILETINSGNSLKVRIMESMEDVIRTNPQAAMLNLILVKEGQNASAEPETQKEEEEIPAEPASEEDKSQSEGLEEDIGLAPDFESEEEGVPLAKELKERAKTEEKPDIEKHYDISTLISSLQMEDDVSSSSFKIEVNTLVAGEMTVSAFIRDFSDYFKRLFSSGNLLCVDLSDYQRLEQPVALRLMLAMFEAKAKGKNLTLNLLKDQREIMASFFPKLQQVEKRKDTTPKFIIIGGRMEIYNVPSEMFNEKFPENFKKLMGCGQPNLVVDISHLHDFPARCIDLLVLSYLEAVGRGLTLTFRIRPEMEEDFKKSGRGKSLPVEVFKPEMSSKIGLQEMKQKPSIDMNKIREAGQDRLTQKVLEKQYDTVHIESRGTIQNWEPIPVKAEEKETVYKGPERRVDKRYKADTIEVMFARGSIAKIVGRRYPVHNLSHSGVCFTCAVSLTKNEPLRLKLFREDLSAEVGAKVIWTKPVPSQALFRIGVQFTAPSDISKAQIRQIIEKIYKNAPK